jgi:phenylacetate-CoA ligase
MYGVVGGEAMSEALRTRLEKQFIAVYSAYGASDLDIGVAGEFPLSIRIRQEAASNPALAEALFGEGSRLPMLFQYNPLDYYVETNAAGELVVTVNRLSMLSPRIRYNVHDAGGALSFERAIAICRDFGLDPIAEAEARTGIPAFRLPFLFIRGRSDSTLSYMGANIYPEDVEAGLFSDAGDGDRLGAFCLELVEREGGAGRPCVHVEVAKGSPEDPDLAVRLAGRVRDHLIAASRDFRSASAEDSEHGQILIRLHGHNEGPFAENSHRIKRRYIVQ